MVALKTCWATKSMCVVVWLIRWQDALLLASIERLVILKTSLNHSSFHSFRFFASTGNRPLLCLCGQLRQRRGWPSCSIRNGWGRQWCVQGCNRTVWRGHRGWSQQVNRSRDFTVWNQNSELLWWISRINPLLLVMKGGAVWSLDQSWTRGGLTYSAIMRTDPTFCSRIMEMGLLLIRPSGRVSIHRKIKQLKPGSQGSNYHKCKSTPNIIILDSCVQWLHLF